MPPTTEELAAQLERETDHRERAIKYAHNMMEDLKEAFSQFRVDVSRIEGRVDQYVSDSERREKYISDIKKDLETIKRLVWLGVGGITVIGSLVMIVGNNIVKLLAR